MQLVYDRYIRELALTDQWDGRKFILDLLPPFSSSAADLICNINADPACKTPHTNQVDVLAEACAEQLLLQLQQ